MIISINPPTGLKYPEHWVVSKQRKVINPAQPVEIGNLDPKRIENRFIKVYDEERTPVYLIENKGKIRYLDGLETIRKIFDAIVEYKGIKEYKIIMDIVKQHKSRLDELV